ncbi:tryptase-related [Holotrichia oblita]|uniref:Tryptase-related n=1 Tax=Holotrichia oblita TaxID=644536 RepID=A0ACB9SUN9_HOLOL|nr:tryptase-related [Holotrichia oblita]
MTDEIAKQGVEMHFTGLEHFFGQLINKEVQEWEDERNDLPLDFLPECGLPNQQNRIVGGRPTGVNKYPWVARLMYDGHYHCGASLLTQDYVLTAAHCVRRLKRSKMRVVIGDHDLTTTEEAPAKMRAVSAVIRHRNFDANSYNHDIALLKLRKSVVFTKNIRPICLPEKPSDPAGKVGTVIGWGRTAEGGMLPGIVQEVQVPILTLTQCRAMKYRASKITSYMLCAGRGAMDSCQGDSGGPLVVHQGDKYEIVGIVSWGAQFDDEDGRQLFSGRFGLSNSNSPPPRHDTPPSACNCKCGVPDDNPRIVNGTSVETHEFPWMARLSYFNRFYCGGMLINDRYVLTAAHCVKGFMWFMIKVTFGELDRCDDKDRPESRFVLRAVAGAFSFLNFDNDIALLRLNDRVPITDKIKPICLPTRTDNLYVGVKATATGWGTLKEDGKPSCILQKVEVPVISNEECRMTNYTSKMISDNMMCAGYPKTGEKDSCQGDSGGPLIAARPNKQHELIGVVSWGNGCARAGYPGVYTRVTRYLDWILQNSRDGCFCKD